jgi:hypothetical protein
MSASDLQIEEVIGVMREYLDRRTTSNLEINRRLDMLVGELGRVTEQGHRLDDHDNELEQIRVVQQTMLGVLEHAQAEFDARTQVVLKDAEFLRSSVREAMLTFQKAQDDQNEDWDDKWQALVNDLERIRKELDARAEERASVAVARIGKSERTTIALMVLISSLISSAVTVLVSAMTR